MTPLEIAAKAAYDEWINPVIGIESTWEELPEGHRSRMVESQRAALLALAEIDLPYELMEDALMSAEKVGRDRHCYERGHFRALLHLLAKESQ